MSVNLVAHRQEERSKTNADKSTNRAAKIGRDVNRITRPGASITIKSIDTIISPRGNKEPVASSYGPHESIRRPSIIAKSFQQRRETRYAKEILPRPLDSSVRLTKKQETKLNGKKWLDHRALN